MPFPERIAAAGLPDAFVAHWPLAVDGLALWNAIGAYVRAFLVPFFPDDAAPALPLFRGEFQHHVRVDGQRD